MNGIKFPILEPETLADTRNSIHLYSKVLGSFRAAHTPPIKHFWHISLKTWAQGFTTTPVPASNGDSFQLFLNLIRHKIEIATSSGKYSEIDIEGLSQKELAVQIGSFLSEVKIDSKIDIKKLDEKHRPYSCESAELIFTAFFLADMSLKEFRSSLTEECSPVQIWPHHFDIAFNWFSGRKIPGENPDDIESSSEQIGYGFLTGDRHVSEPYFYVLPYPAVELDDISFTHGGLVYNDKWKGVMLKYNDVISAEDPGAKLVQFFKDSHKKIKKRF